MEVVGKVRAILSQYLGNFIPVIPVDISIILSIPIVFNL